jgi:hypothetical protein
VEVYRDTSAPFRKWRAVPVFLLIASFQAGAMSQAIRCTHSDAEKADREASRLENWYKLYHSYTLYSGCDEGSIGEGYSESVVRLTAHHWDELSKALPLFASHPDFYRFVLRHIDPTTSNDDLKSICRNAKRSCPSGGGEVCSQIRRASENALRENGIMPSLTVEK